MLLALRCARAILPRETHVRHAHGARARTQSSLTNSMNCYGFFSSTGSAVFAQLQSYTLETGYDYMYFLNGGLSTSPVLGTINGAGVASATYCGTGASLGMHFRTDGSVIAGGFTVAAWRDGWYCSGNLGYKCAAGYYGNTNLFAGAGCAGACVCVPGACARARARMRRLVSLLIPRSRGRALQACIARRPRAAH